MSKNHQTLEQILGGLMSRYHDRVPDVAKVVNLMVSGGLINSMNDIENDHIAFRTMGVPNLGIASLEKIFLHCGYQRRDAYHFAQKKLDAFWYSPPNPKYPRIFISELRVGDLSAEAQTIINSYCSEVTSDPVDRLDLEDGRAVDEFLHSPLWRTPTWLDFQTLEKESEYAAWVIYNRYYLNHFTISVHNLPEGYNTIPTFNQFLEAGGLTLNNAGGKAKVSDDGLLIQSSTVAEMTEAKFDDGNGGEEIHEISGSYIEFAERKTLPEDAEGKVQRRDGFEAGNADKIFESTYTEQTSRT